MTEVCRQCPFFRASFLIVLIMIRPGIVVSESDLLTNFFSGYDNAVRPDLDKSKPLVISSDLYVEAFGNIKEANMEYLVHGYFRQKWKDSRLAGRLKYPLTLKGAGIENIWVPDPYCYNARESNMMMPDTQLHSRISVDPSGDVLYSKGLTLLASCNMDLRNFPLDSQSCSLKFGSYGYTTNDIIYEWSPAGVVVGNNEMAQFEYKSNNISSSIENFSVGNFSTISVKFLFERRVGYYLIQVYFPDIFVVALSWIVFWMDKTEMGDRMALGITTILAIMFLLGSLNGNLPKVSYPKALDWYLLVSFSFVFMSLVECIIVFILNLRASGCKINELSLSKRIFSSIKGAIGRFDQSITGYNGSSKTTRTGFEDDDLEMVNLASKADKSVIDDATVDFAGNEKSGISADSLDKASRVLFPLSFITFNIVYWVYFSLFG